MATGAVVTTAAGDEHDDNKENQNEGDDPKHLHPAWCELCCACLVHWMLAVYRDKMS